MYFRSMLIGFFDSCGWRIVVFAYVPWYLLFLRAQKLDSGAV